MVLVSLRDCRAPRGPCTHLRTHCIPTCMMHGNGTHGAPRANLPLRNADAGRGPEMRSPDTLSYPASADTHLRPAVPLPHHAAALAPLGSGSGDRRRSVARSPAAAEARRIHCTRTAAPHRTALPVLGCGRDTIRYAAPYALRSFVRSLDVGVDRDRDRGLD